MGGWAWVAIGAGVIIVACVIVWALTRRRPPRTARQQQDEAVKDLYRDGGA